MAVTKNYADIVRVKGADLKGNKSIAIALTKIKGVGYNFAKAVVSVSKIDESNKLKDIDEKQIQLLENIIDDPEKYKIPSWLYNRRNDPLTGDNIHITETDIKLFLREDVNTLKKIRSYRGIRHELGLTMRGQRTKSSFRSKGATASRKKK
ncbi:MAG: 30S ribosomal protein S13 [DPANN group archaeon]|nr:30S ribosomal protein S13 [DPANN group archaeon]